MDMVFHRYADPMTFMDMMIQSNSFADFVTDAVKARNEEEEEKAVWEMWLHKIDDQSFADFRSKLKNCSDNKAPTDEDIELTVNASYGMLDGFVPDGVLENDGTVSAAGDSGD